MCTLKGQMCECTFKGQICVRVRAKVYLCVCTFKGQMCVHSMVRCVCVYTFTDHSEKEDSSYMITDCLRIKKTAMSNTSYG